MGDHYVPQYYLKGFTDLYGHIWVYEKGTSKIYASNPKNVGTENNRWPPEIERYLGQNIEDPVNPILDKIRRCDSITLSEKQLLSIYMVAMLQRVPEGFSRFEQTATEIVDPFFHTFEKQLKDLIHTQPDKREKLEQHLLKLPEIKSQYQREISREVYYSTVRAEALPRLGDALVRMKWNFFVSEKKQSFVTCDNPVHFFKGIGIGTPDSEVSFPISSDVCLWATWKKEFKNVYIPAKDTVIQEMNRRIVSNYTKYVYCSHEALWLVNLVNKTKYRLNKLN